MTPMEQGLRVVGTVEFGGLDNPLSKSRIKNLIDNAKYMLDGLKKIPSLAEAGLSWSIPSRRQGLEAHNQWVSS